MRPPPVDIVIPSTLLHTTASLRTYGPNSVRIGCGVWLGDRTHDEIDVVHPFFALGWVLRGAMTYVDDRGQRAQVRAGEAYLRLPGRRHSSIYEDPAYVEAWVDLGGQLASFPEAAGLVDATRPVLAPGIDLSLLRRWHAAVAAMGGAGDATLPLLASELLALTVDVVRLDRAAGGDPHGELIDEACRMLDAAPESHGRLERLARGYGLGYERFRKLFRARVGCAPGAYRARRRLDRARELLLTTDLPIREIAAQLGYASVATFTLRFRAHVGAPPERFRSRAQPG